MDNLQKAQELEKLRSDIALIKKEKKEKEEAQALEIELKRLKEEKEELLHNSQLTQLIISCTECKSKIQVNTYEYENRKVICPKCKTLNHIIIIDNIIYDEAVLKEFDDKLSVFKKNILYSIFLDVFFIITLSLLFQDNSLKDYKDCVPKKKWSNYQLWMGIAALIILVKVGIFIILGMWLLS